MRPVKVVYNWIGPYGPIWNTEVPNFLGVGSMMTPHVTVHTQKFWAESVWPTIFSHAQPKFELQPACVIEDTDVFIYPFSLSWRISFRNYFVNGEGILEFAHVQGNITHQVRCNGGYFLIDLSAETFIQDDYLMSLHSYFRSYHYIPLNKIIYLTGCMNAKDEYEKFCIRNNIPQEENYRLKILSFPVAKQENYRMIKTGDISEPNYDPEVLPDKLFLMWNRRFRSHRTTIALGLYKYGLLERSFVSMLSESPDNSLMKLQKYSQTFQTPELLFTQEEIDSFMAKLPLVLDNETNVGKMCADIGNTTRPYYQNSLVSIVTETNFNSSEMSLTEKSFKPIREKHPFIIAGVPRVLKAMREMGFKTFGEFWDESYDTEENDSIRITQIINICREIGSWSPQKVLEFRRAVKPILEHNFEILSRDGAVDLATQIYDYIAGMGKL